MVRVIPKQSLVSAMGLDVIDREGGRRPLLLRAGFTQHVVASTHGTLYLADEPGPVGLPAVVIATLRGRLALDIIGFPLVRRAGLHLSTSRPIARFRWS